MITKKSTSVRTFRKERYRKTKKYGETYCEDGTDKFPNQWSDVCKDFLTPDIMNCIIPGPGEDACSMIQRRVTLHSRTTFVTLLT